MNQYINLGQLKTTRIGYGAMGSSEFYGDIDMIEATKTIHRYINVAGKYAMIDTADAYGFGENELFVGDVIKKYMRDEIVLATKGGVVRDRENSTKRGINTSPEYIKKACYSSLERLKVDYIDLYYLHRLDDKTPIEESIKALVELANEGVIKYFGLSEPNADTIEKAYKYLEKSEQQHLFAAVQTEYSLWSRGIEDDGVLDLCRKLNIGLVAYSPLGRGFLTGKINSKNDFEKNDFRKDLPRFSDKNIDKNKLILNKMECIAKELGCTLSQLALAWLLKQKNVVPIPGTKREKYLLENMESIAMDLSPEQLLALDDLPKANGYRYPKAAMDHFKYTD